MKKLISLLRCDFTNSRRDSILLYVILSPILLAAGISLFVPSARGAEVTIAVGSGVSENIVERLETYAQVDTYNSLEGLEKRVAGRDDVPGLYLEEGRYVLLFEGTESDENRSLVSAVMQEALTETAVKEGEISFAHEQAGEGRTDVRNVLTLMMVMLASLIGGLTVGFNILEERSNRITNALSVSPIKIRTYLGAKALFAGILGFFVSVFSVVIITGFRLPWE